jgi:hypothetical protein
VLRGWPSSGLQKANEAPQATGSYTSLWQQAVDARCGRCFGFEQQGSMQVTPLNLPCILAFREINLEATLHGTGV